MTEATEPSRDELASAYLDGDLTDEAAAELEADAELMARVARLRLVSEAVAAPVASPSPAEAAAVLAAALREFDAGGTAVGDGARDDDQPGEAPAVAPPTPLAGRRRSPRKIWLPPPAVAVAAVLIVAVLGIGLIVADLGSSDSDSNAASEPSAQESADAVALGDQPPAEVPDLGGFADQDELEVALRAVDITLDPTAATAMAAPAAGPVAADESAPPASDLVEADPATTAPADTEETTAGDSGDEAAGGGTSSEGTARESEAPKLAEVPAASIDRCDQVIRGTDSTLGERLAVASAEIAGRAVLVFSHPVTGSDQGATPVTRLTAADSESCQVLVAVQR